MAERRHGNGSPRSPRERPSAPASGAAAAAVGRKTRVPTQGSPPRGKKHDPEEDAPTAESIVASAIDDIVNAGAALLEKRDSDRKCFKFAASAAATLLLENIRICYVTVEKNQCLSLRSSGSNAEDGLPPPPGSDDGDAWDHTPLPQPGPLDSWAPGVAGVVTLTQEQQECCKPAKQKKKSEIVRRSIFRGKDSIKEPTR